MKLCACPRVSSVLVLSFVYVFLMRKIVSSAHTPSIYPLTFTLLTSPTRGVKRLGEGWTSTSVISCAISCRSKYETCRSFMFNSDTGLCTPGSLYSDTEPLPSMAEGNFYHSFRCDVDKHFTVRRYGNVTACIGFFGPNMTYTEADDTCKSKGAYLLSAKTPEKLQLIDNFRGSNNLWIGCDDMEEEGTFVWKDEGEIFNLDNIPKTFNDGQPDNLWGDEDCAILQNGWYLLNDYRCYLPHAVAACEMPLP